MKIYLANYEPNRIGGGWSFANNFVKSLQDKYTSDYNQADVYFITSASMVSRDDVIKAKTDNKKIVLRVDNVIRNSRNRNTGMSRMKDFASIADLVIYQSEAVKELLEPFLKTYNSTVILNSSDADIYHNKNRTAKENTYLYSRYNRDETKNWEVARDYFTRVTYKEPDSFLYLCGQFSPEMVEYNFDFYADEKYQFLGVITNPNQMADVYRNVDKLIYTYWQDACSNTLIEALLSGCKIDFVDNFFKKGSADEIMFHFKEYGREYFSLDRMNNDYIKNMEKI